MPGPRVHLPAGVFSFRKENWGLFVFPLPVSPFLSQYAILTAAGALLQLEPLSLSSTDFLPIFSVFVLSVLISLPIVGW